MNTIVGKAGKMPSPPCNCAGSHKTCAQVRALLPIYPLNKLDITGYFFSLVTKLSFSNFRHLCADRIFFFRLNRQVLFLTVPILQNLSGIVISTTA